MLGCLSNQVNELSGQTTIGWLTRQPGEERFSFFAQGKIAAMVVESIIPDRVARAYREALRNCLERRQVETVAGCRP